MDYLSDTTAPPGGKGVTHVRTRRVTAPNRRIPGFWWTGKIFWRGYHRRLDEADVYDVLPRNSTVKLSGNLAKEWEEELYLYKTGGRPSLTRALWRCYSVQIMAFTLLLLVEESMRMSQTYLMARFIGLFEVSDINKRAAVNNYNSTHVISRQRIDEHVTLKMPEVYIILSLMAFCYLMSVFLDHNFFHHGYKMRVATTSLIYRKVMRLCSSALTPVTMETVMNLVTKDMDVFPVVVLPATYILIGPIQLAVTCYMMWAWLDLGPASLASLLVLVCLFPLQIAMGRLSKAIREKMEDLSSSRLAVVQLIMSGLEEMKASNLTQFCCSVVDRARRLELYQMSKLGRLQVLNSALTLTSGKVVVMATFLLLVVTGVEISARQVFTALALEESLRISLSVLLPGGLLALTDTLATVRKVQDILLLAERSPTPRESRISESDNVAVRFKSYFASKQKTADAPMVLVNVDLKIEKSKMYSIVGPPNSGKSYLLLAVLGELDRHKGHVTHQGRLGYVPSQPWICPGTLRDNIVFGAEFSYNRYMQVLDACALTQVVDTLALRDQTVIGERGLSLDHSIQVKITLARAVYQNCDIYLIDDILKGLDSKSAAHIFKRCICGFLQSKTRLFVTDSLHHTQTSHNNILMSQCRVVNVDSYDRLLAIGIDIKQILSSKTCYDLDNNLEMDKGKQGMTSNPIIQELAMTNMAFNMTPNPMTSSVKDSPAGSAFDILQADFKESGDPLISADCESDQGGVFHHHSVYTSYFLLGGGLCGILFFICTCLLEQSSFVLCEWWLAHWSENHQNVSSALFHHDVPVLGDAVKHLDYHIYMYMGLVCCAVVGGVLQASVFYILARRAGAALHDTAMSSLLAAPLGFFYTNSKASILNHFARDVGIVDSLPPVFLDSIQSLSMLLATCVVISCVNYWMLLLTVPLVLVFLWARRRFNKATQGVERIEIASKNAVGSHLVSSMEGIQTLRSLAVEQRFLHKFDVIQDRSTAACYLHLAANRWFGLRFDLIGLFTIIGVMLSSVLVVKYQGRDLPASLVGLSLYYAVNLINISQPAIRKSAAVHFKMNSVRHLFQYAHLMPEIPALPDLSDPPGPWTSLWPRYGIVTCEGVSVPPIRGGHSKGGNLLKNVWCCIRAQEKMGIIFSTESEQQSFLAMLFRLTPFVGTVRLDGVEITSIQRDKLRERMAYISHNPTLLLGSVRENIDKDKTFTDVQVWQALEQVHMSSLVSSLPNKLDTDISILADILTIGQKQLLRLARALLVQSRVVIYEEASSSLDVLSSSIIHDVLRSCFPTSTVIHIAHLPDTIIDMDRIMIFKGGRVVEVDTPHYLLESSTSRLSAMVSELASAPHLRQVARDKHENRPYKPPPVDPADVHELGVSSISGSGDLRPGKLNVLPTFHSSRLAGVLNQLPTNKFSTDRL